MNMYLNLSRTLGRSALRTCISKPYQSFLPVTTSAVKQSNETHMEKNIRLNRPLSPHLSIYKFQITSVLSITHRATGLVLTGGLYAFSIGMLFLPASYPYYFEYLQQLHIASPLIYSFKFSLAWVTFYHTFNGIRHLAWDMGYGYDIKTLYLTGYLVLGTSLGASILAALM